MIMRKICTFLLIVALAITVVGCQSSSAPTPAPTPPPAESTAPSVSDAPASPAVPAQKQTIALCIAQTTNEFQSRIKDAMLDYAAATGLDQRYDFTVFDANFDTATQLQQVENAIAQGVAGIVLIAVDAEGSMATLAAANEAGVPIVGCNTEVADNTQFTSYVGSDTLESGRIEMRALAEAMGGEGKIVEMHGNYGEDPQIKRNAGIREVIAEYPNIKVVAEDTAKWSREQGVELMENWIQAGIMNDVKAIVAHNDAMAVGAMIALEDAGMTDVLIAGIDANQDMLGYLQEGRVAVTVFQNAVGQGEGAIAKIAKIIEGEPYEQFVWIPYELVLPEDADKFLIDKFLA